VISLKKFSKRFSGFRKGNVEEQSIYILTRARQISLQSDFQQFTEGDEKAVGDKYPELIEEIRQLGIESDKFSSQDDLSLIEQLMIPLYSDTRLDVELGRRTVEIEGFLSEDMLRFYKEAATDTDHKTKQAILKNLVSEIWWQTAVFDFREVLSTRIRQRTGVVFILSVLVFVIVNFLFQWLEGWVADTTTYQTMTVSMAAGVMGSAFSLLIGLRERLESASLEELLIQQRFGVILSRISIGLGAALILNFFLQANLLSGTLLPEFHFSDGRMLPLDSVNYSLLIVWSFISGFSEQFVPNIIGQTEEQVTINEHPVHQ